MPYTLLAARGAMAPRRVAEKSPLSSPSWKMLQNSIASATSKMTTVAALPTIVVM